MTASPPSRTAPTEWPVGLFTIPPHQPFLDTLAHGLLRRCAGHPMALARITIMLPTRRACRALQAAFLEQAEQLYPETPEQTTALLLPRMQPIGDVDEDELLLTGDDPGLGPLPPVIGTLDRQLRLTRAILAARDDEHPVAHEVAADLAAELAGLLDQFHTEGLSLDRLTDLPPERYASHWQDTLRFLAVLREHWPQILEQLGAIDPARHRDQWLQRAAQRLTDTRPDDPVIIAGSTGSIPATMALMQAVLALPKGAVILPGLDSTTDPGLLDRLPESHPQYLLARLLRRLDWPTGRPVPDWPRPWPDADQPPANAAQRQLLIRAITHGAALPGDEPAKPQPADALSDALAQLDPAGLDGITPVACHSTEHEALVAALTMRQVLEPPDGLWEGSSEPAAWRPRTAMLVTPDRDIAERVTAALMRFGIRVNDSAGRPLADTPTGSWLRLTAQLLAGEFRPRALLAVLKHPLAALGQQPARCREAVRLLERLLLRGLRPGPGLAGLYERLAQVAANPDHPPPPEPLARCQALLDALAAAWHPAGDALGLGDDGSGGQQTRSLQTLIGAHIQLIEALAHDDTQPGAERIWAHEDGEAAAGFLAELSAAAEGFPPVRLDAYGDFLTALMRGRVVRPHQPAHPQLTILGLLEARLVRADRVILAGLNEGTWPPEPAADPWLSRPMRRRIGLPTPERRLGQTAHDFAQLLGAPEVFLLRTERQGGAMTVPARWWQYLDVLLSRWKQDGLDKKKGPFANMQRRAHDWQQWGKIIDQPDDNDPRSCAEPCPQPPGDARPNRLSVTDIELLMRNPYGFYARRVLKLRKLDDLELDPGAAERGSFIHEALDQFVTAFPDQLPPDAKAQLIAIGEQVFASVADRPEIHAFWWARFVRLAGWFIEQETRHRTEGWRPAATETSGRQIMADITLHGRADRIDRASDSRLAIIDYKTGSVPSAADVYAGLSPQLVLEALIASEGSGFDQITPAPVAALSYWQLSGSRSETGKITGFGDDVLPALIDHARDGLAALLAKFADPAMPYLAMPRPANAPRHDDYRHLSRHEEWAPGLLEEQG